MPLRHNGARAPNTNARAAHWYLPRVVYRAVRAGRAEGWRPLPPGVRAGWRWAPVWRGADAAAVTRSHTAWHCAGSPCAAVAPAAGGVGRRALVSHRRAAAAAALRRVG